MTGQPDKLTISAAVRLGEVLGAAQRCARVARLMDSGDIVYGTARHLSRFDGDGAHFGSEGDVRDAFLRVTTTSGWEVWWPVRELMELVADGTFAIDVEPPR